MYYKTTYGLYLGEDDIQNAFYITTGKLACESREDYDKYVKSIMGKSIVEVSDPSIEDLVANDQKVIAIRLYEKENNCSVHEAVEHIKSLQGTVKKERVR